MLQDFAVAKISGNTHTNIHVHTCYNPPPTCMQLGLIMNLISNTNTQLTCTMGVLQYTELFILN